MAFWNLIARISANTTGIEAAMGRVDRGVNRLASNIKGQLVGALGAAFSIDMVRRVVEYGGKIQDLSVQTKLSVEELQKLDYAASQAGSSLDELVGAAAKFGKVRAGILGGGNDREGAILERMGIGRAQLESQSVMQTMRQVADFISKTDLGNDEGAIFQALFGRGAEGLIPVFQQGLGQMGDELERIGGIMDSRVVAALDQIGDGFDRTIFKARGFLNLLVDANSMMVGIAQFMKDNPVLSMLNPAGILGGGLAKVAERGKQDQMLALMPFIKAGLFPGNSSGAGGSMFSDIFADKDGDTGKAKSARRQSFRLGIDEISRAGGAQGMAGTRNVQLEVAQQQLNVQKKIENNTRKGQGSGLQLSP